MADGPLVPEASCLFKGGGRCLAVPLGSVAEVIAVERLVRLPLAPPRVLGLAPLRRDLVPVVHLGAVAPSGPGHSVLVLKLDHGPIGIAVEPGATLVVREPPDDSGPGPLGPDRDVPGAYAWMRHGAREATLVDPKRAWDGLRDAIGLWHAQSAGLLGASES